MKSYDIILIHPSRVMEKKREPNRSLFLLAPMGLVAIADKCEQEGFSTKIINYPLEQILNPQFSLENFLQQIDFKICGIALHWALHSYGAMEIAKIVKKVNPNAKVVLGGFTASYFHDEILKYYKSVDAVIKGEGEIPFVEYCQNILHGKSVESVPNLSYRTNNHRIKIKPISYVADSLDNFNFSNLSLVHNIEKYVELGVKIMKMQYPLPMARGCPYNCPYCGGGSRAQRLINGRTKVILRSPEKVVEDIQTINSTYKVNGIFFGHGIYPGTFKYWKNLFQLIRKEKMDIGSDLEIWRLPFPKEIWPLYARTFNPEISSLAICPRSLSPRVQQKVRETCDPSYNFPKRKIQDLIQQSLKYNIILRIWFTIGFPFQTRLDLLKDYLFTLKLALKYGSSKIFPITVLNDLVTIIPGSPAFESPGTYEVSLTFNSFPQIVDMYKKAKFVFGGWNSVINYQNKYMTNIEMRMWNRIFNATELPMFINSTH